MLIDSLENKERILETFLTIAGKDGWNDESLRKAALDCDFSDEELRLIFDGGALEVADYFINNTDQQMLEKMQTAEFNEVRIRDKVREALKNRLIINDQYKMAIDKLLKFYLKPAHLAYGFKNCFNTADLIWKQIGDSATDFNFYTKRILLAKIYILTLFYFVKDQSPNNQKTLAFLDGQIAKVMRVARLKSEISNLATGFKDCSIKDVVKKLPFFRLFK